LAILGVVLWAVFRFVLPIVILIALGTYVNQKNYSRRVI
jgi:hypothetical protein